MAEEASSVGDGTLDFGEKLVVILGGILSTLVLTGLNPVLPKIEAALAHGPTDQMLVKQLIGAASLAMVLGAPLGGFLVSLVGLRRMVILATTTYVIAGTSGLYIDSLPLLVASRFLLGVASASIQVTSLTLINTRLQGNQRARWMGLHVSISMFCTLAIYPLSGALGDADWRLPFGEYAIGLVLLAGSLFGNRNFRVTAKPTSIQMGQDAQDRSSIWNWFPWHYLFLAFLAGALSLMPSVYIPYLLSQKAGLSAKGISFALTGMSLTGALAALSYGRARAKLSAHAAMAVSFGLAGIGCLSIALAASLPFMVAGMLILGIGGAWFVPNVIMSLGSKVDAEHQSRAAGLTKAAHFLAGPLCVLLLDPYARRFGPAVVLEVSSIVAFAAFLAALLRLSGRLNFGLLKVQPH